MTPGHRVTLLHRFSHRLGLFVGTVKSFAFARKDRKPGVVIVIGFECSTCGRLSGVHATRLYGSLDPLEGF